MKIIARLQAAECSEICLHFRLSILHRQLYKGENFRINRFAIIYLLFFQMIKRQDVSQSLNKYFQFTLHRKKMVGLVENAINTAKTLIDTYHDFYKKNW